MVTCKTGAGPCWALQPTFAAIDPPILLFFIGYLSDKVLFPYQGYACAAAGHACAKALRMRFVCGCPQPSLPSPPALSNCHHGRVHACFLKPLVTPPPRTLSPGIHPLLPAWNSCTLLTHKAREWVLPAFGRTSSARLTPCYSQAALRPHSSH